MPFSGTTFTPVSGAITAAPGQIVQSAVWNNINNDYATALTMLMSQLCAVTTDRNALSANGSFEIWQRSSGATASMSISAAVTQYTADRWYISNNANQASVVAATTGLSGNSQLAAKVTRNVGQTGVGGYTFGYPLDTDEIYRLRGHKISLSLLAQAAANWSPTNGTLVVAFYTGTGAVSKRGSGFTGEVTVLSISTNLTPGGSITAIAGESSVIVPTNATQAELQFTWTPVGTAGADDSVILDDIELDAELASSSVDWTPMQYDRITFDEMLYHCKRHYQKTLPYNVAPDAGTAVGFLGALSFNLQVVAAQASIWWQYPVEMRVTASCTTFNPAATNANWINSSISVSYAVSVRGTLSQSTKCVYIVGIAATATNPAVGTTMYIQAQADAGI